MTRIIKALKIDFRAFLCDLNAFNLNFNHWLQNHCKLSFNLKFEAKKNPSTREGSKIINEVVLRDLNDREYPKSLNQKLDLRMEELHLVVLVLRKHRSKE